MFRFANPGALWLLLAFPVLFVFSLLHRWLRGRRLSRLAQGSVALERLYPYRSRWRYWLQQGLLYLGLSLVVLAYARPQFGIRESTVQRTGSEIMIVLDVSRSMLAEDVRPNRLERAKMEIQQLVMRMQGDRVGLILFAGDAFVQLPITNDYRAALMFISQVNVNMVSNQGTALASALSLAEKSFSPLSGIGRAVVVISDGENHEEDPLPVARRMHESGIRIFCVGVGSPPGSPIAAGAGGSFITDRNGQVVVSRLDEQVLSSIAVQSGGAYVRLGSGGSALERIMTSLENLEKAEFDVQVYSAYNEQYQFFLGAGLLFLVLGAVVYTRRHPWFSIDRLYSVLSRSGGPRG